MPRATTDIAPLSSPAVQARGQARIDAILAATAEMIAEEGVSAVTMHLVAKRARTSVGSMYHFFPDRESLLTALIQGHSAAMRQINQQLKAIPAREWQQLSADEAITRLVTPYVQYIDAHPDFLDVTHGRATREDDADFMLTVRHVLKARLPGLASKQREDYVAVIHAIAAGGMHIGYQNSPQRAPLFLREVPRVLAAYLAQIEHLHNQAR